MKLQNYILPHYPSFATAFAFLNPKYFPGIFFANTLHFILLPQIYEGRLISNAHSEISRKRDHVFKQMKVGSKVQYFSYKLTYLFFDILALLFNTFFPNVKQVYACCQ